jgi:hypothetical protein
MMPTMASTNSVVGKFLMCSLPCVHGRLSNWPTKHIVLTCLCPTHADYSMAEISTSYLATVAAVDRGLNHIDARTEVLCSITKKFKSVDCTTYTRDDFRRDFAMMQQLTNEATTIRSATDCISALNSMRAFRNEVCRETSRLYLIKRAIRNCTVSDAAKFLLKAGLSGAVGAAIGAGVASAAGAASFGGPIGVAAAFGMLAYALYKAYQLSPKEVDAAKRECKEKLAALELRIDPHINLLLKALDECLKAINAVAMVLLKDYDAALATATCQNDLNKYKAAKKAFATVHDIITVREICQALMLTPISSAEYAAKMRAPTHCTPIKPCTHRHRDGASTFVCAHDGCECVLHQECLYELLWAADELGTTAACPGCKKPVAPPPGVDCCEPGLHYRPMLRQQPLAASKSI